MRMMLRTVSRARWLSVVAALLAGALAVAATAAPALSFRVDEGDNINSLVRDGPVAAHLLLRSGKQPRILVAFPAGNSGVGLWFAKTTEPVSWTLVGAPRPISGTDRKGRALRGIEAEAIVHAAKLGIEQAVLSSVRVLRDYQALQRAPSEVLASPVVAGNKVVWARDRLDGAAGYELSIEALDGGKITASSVANPNGRVSLRIRALTGETPLTPLDVDSLLTARAVDDEQARDGLMFLSYREKFLAGSWRFNTYFGRDTLMSLSLLAAVLQPQAMESGIGSVLARLAPNGEVAHEEDIGEFAVLRNAKEGRGKSDRPIYDYGMLDDDFMLPIVAARWLLDSDVGRSRAKAFLAARSESGSVNGEALTNNLRWVVERTGDFAADPRPPKLVGLKEGRTTGQWRDSETGLAYGRYAYDVNAVLVPAALDAVDRLLRSSLLDPYINDASLRILLRAAPQRQVWQQKAPPLFAVTIPARDARKAVAEYANAIGVDDKAALASLPDDGSVAFNALSLDAAGGAAPVLHSDDGFALLFTTPAPAQVQRSVEAMMRPFPAGLLTPIGLLVANPAFANRDTQALFTSNAYHGTVVWSWQQAVLAAGLDRQLARTDLPASLRTQLSEARKQLWSAIDGAGELRNSELWSWSFAGGRYRAEPFGQRGGDVDESNAVQLWSTVFLGIPRPR